MNNLKPSEYAIEIEDDDIFELEKSRPAETIDDGTPVMIEVDRLDDNTTEENAQIVYKETEKLNEEPEIKSTVSFGASSTFKTSQRRMYCYSFGQPEGEYITGRSYPPVPIPHAPLPNPQNIMTTTIPYTISEHQYFTDPVSYKEQKNEDIIEFYLDRDEEEERLPAFGNTLSVAEPSYEYSKNQTTFSKIFPSYPELHESMDKKVSFESEKEKRGMHLDVSAMIIVPTPYPIQCFVPDIEYPRNLPAPPVPMDHSAIIHIPKPDEIVSLPYFQAYPPPPAPEPIEMSIVEIRRDQSAQSSKSVRSAESVKSNSLTSSLYQSTEEYIRKIEMNGMDLKIQTNLQELSKTFSFELIQYMEYYFLYEYKILLPNTSPSIFKLEYKVTSQYIEIYARFLKNNYSYKLIKFMKMDVQLTKKEEVQSMPMQWFNWAKDYVGYLTKTKVYKLPIEKLAYFVITGINAQEKIRNARNLIKNVTGTNISPCPIENINYDSQRKLMCLTEWLVGFYRAHRTIQEKIQSLGNYTKNRALLEFHNKLLKNYLAVKSQEMDACREELQLNRSFFTKS